MDYKNELNEKQYEAVCASDKYLRIIAGAGSGKTRVLTYRIAYLIEMMNVRPSQILAITFTNKVAKEMKERTLSLLPDYDLTYLSISTFHAWCAKFLRREIDVLGYPKNYIIYDDDDQLRLIKEIGTKFGFKKTDDNNKSALNYISKHKTLGHLPSDIEINKFKDTKQEELMLNYFIEYEKAKNSAKALDFDDLLIYTIKILENFDDIRMKYRYRYHDILIDEFQDTNDLQFRLLRNLVGPETSLYVVGDPDQTIYTWRGANQKIILDIGQFYSPMNSIILNQNYRSTTEILNTANKLIAHNQERLKKDLFTENKGGEPVVLKNLDNSISEANYIANTIEEIKAKDPSLTYKDFAILYRSSYLSVKIENALTTRRIPYNVYGGIKFYSRKEIKDCLAYFRLLINNKDNVSFDRIINVPKRGIGDKTLALIKDEATKNDLSYLEYIENLNNFDTEIKLSIKNKLDDLANDVISTRKKLQENQEAYSEIVDNFLKDIGYYDFLEDDEDNNDQIENVKALIDDIRNYLKGNEDSTFDEYLQNVSLLTSQDDIDGSDKVSLMTVHTAKGLEFNYVFVMGLNDGVFPNQRSLNETALKGLEEERRLAYVAFTRARKQLFLTLNKDYSYIIQAANIPSRFIKEAGIELPSFNFSSSFENSSNNERIYKYNFDKYSNGNGLSKEKERNSDRRGNLVDLNSGNNIQWKIGDIAIHRVFGEGKVTSVEGDIITVDFLDFGIKRLLGSHKALSKKG